MKIFKSTFLTIYSILFLIGCESNVEVDCIDCSDPNFIAAFEDKILQVGFDSTYTIIIVEKDSVTNESIIFSPCSNEVLNQLELGKILRVNGEIFENCNLQAPRKIKIDAASIIEYCHSPIPEMEGEFTIFNKWYIYAIETPDTLLYIPCESIGAMIEFQNGNPPIMIGQTNPNSFFAEVLINENTITTSEDFTQTLAVGTQAQTFFEAMVHQVIGRESEAFYEINKNILMIKNEEKGIILTLYYH